MFNCCTLNATRSCGGLEKCINCRINCGWINGVHKHGNYVCHDSLSISDLENRLHLNSQTCVNWLKIPSTEYLFYIWTLFSFPESRQENLSWSLCQLSSLPVLQHAGHGVQGNVVHHWSYQILTKTALFGTTHPCHSWELEVFLDWRSHIQLCAGPPLSVLRGTRESGPEFKDSKCPLIYWKWHHVAHLCSTLCSPPLGYRGGREKCRLFPQFSSFLPFLSSLLFKITYPREKAPHLSIAMIAKLCKWLRKEEFKREVVNKLRDSKMQSSAGQSCYCDFSKLHM